MAMAEIIIIALVILRLNKVIKRYLELKSSGACRLDSLEQSLATIIPGFVAKTAVLELRIYNVIFQSIFKRNSPNGQFLTKRDTHRLFLLAFMFISLLEAGIIEVAIPGRYLAGKILLLILTIWAMVYITGLYLAVARYGHRILDDGIKMQVGLGLKGFVLFNEIKSVAELNKVIPFFKMGPFIPKDEKGVMYAAAGENCNIAVYLNKEVILDGYINKFKPVSIIYLSLEDPKRFILTVSERLQS